MKTSLIFTSLAVAGFFFVAVVAQTDLNALYNSRVARVELVRRPLGSSGGSCGSIYVPHAGVRLTLEDGSQWLVHKGKKYGGSGGETVVTPASHMSGRWEVVRAKRVSGPRVGDYVRAGGTAYSVLTDNCLHAASRMYDVQ